MWLLNTESQGLREFSGKLPVETRNPLLTTPRYAILSHCWDKGDSEVLFKDIQDLNHARWMPGYTKIQKCCELACKTGYKWMWVDTCCIDKSSSAELSEAINSMFKWYEHADACFVYLDDVDNEDPNLPNSSFRKSRWFTRGWTLQELLAPQQVVFFSKSWSFLGTKDRLLTLLNFITKIPIDALSHRRRLDSFSVAQRMSWAANRETTRIEDQAYSLMGLFDIFMPIIYGEGRSAFRRLQLEIIQHSNDQTIFAWSPEESEPYPLPSSIIHMDVRNHRSSPDVEFPFFWGPGLSSILAPSPAGFAGSGCIVPLPTSATPKSPSIPSDMVVYSWTHLGLHIRLPLIPAKTAAGDDQRYVGVLSCWHPKECSMYGIPLICDRRQDGVYYCSGWSVDRSSGRLVSIPQRAYDDAISSKLAVPRDVYITNEPDPFNTRHDRLLNDTSYPDNLASCWAQLTVVFSALSVQRLEQMGFCFAGHASQRVPRSSQVVEVRKLAAGDIVSECRLPPCDDNPSSRRRSSSRGHPDPPLAHTDLLFLNETASQAFSIIVRFSRRHMMNAVAINPEIELQVVFYRPEDVPTLAGQAVYDDYSPQRSPRAERRPEPYTAHSRHVAVPEPSVPVRLLFFGKMSEAVRGAESKEFCDRDRGCLEVSTTKWEVRDEARDVVYGTVWVELSLTLLSSLTSTSSLLARTEHRVRR